MAAVLGEIALSDPRAHLGHDWGVMSLLYKFLLVLFLATGCFAQEIPEGRLLRFLDIAPAV